MVLEFRGFRVFSVSLVVDESLHILIYFGFCQAKKAGSKLQSRQVAPAAVYKWRTKIEEMEDGVRDVMQAERYKD